MSFKNSTKNELFDQLLDTLEVEFGTESQILPIIPWAESLLLDGRRFSLKQHEYQRNMLMEEAPRQVLLKGAQIGVTSIIMLKTLYGLIAGRYPQGAL